MKWTLNTEWQRSHLFSPKGAYGATELNWTDFGLVFDELTNGQAGRRH